jgi:hypothetical protein
MDRQLAIFTRATVEVAGVLYPLRFYGSCAREIARAYSIRESASGTAEDATRHY